MRFVKVLALIVGSVLLIGVVFQSVLIAAAVFILLCGFGGIWHTRAMDRAILNLRQHQMSAGQGDPRDFYVVLDGDSPYLESKKAQR